MNGLNLETTISLDVIMRPTCTSAIISKMEQFFQKEMATLLTPMNAIGLVGFDKAKLNQTR